MSTTDNPVNAINEKEQKILEERLKIEERLKMEERLKIEEADLLLIQELFSDTKELNKNTKKEKNKKK